MRVLRLVPGILLLFTGCAKPPPHVANHREEALRSVRAAEEAALEAFGRRDSELAASFYAPDAALLMPGTPVARGPAIKPLLRKLMADPNFSVSYQTAKFEAAESGELGYTRGTYAMTMTDPQTRKVMKETGKYLTVYAKQADGSWKIIDDVTTPDAPAAPVAP
jgi:uncharacterized protein (TIGR02246 family)